MPSISHTLVWIYYLKGSHRLALPRLQECVRKIPDHAIYDYHQGVVELARWGKSNAKS